MTSEHDKLTEEGLVIHDGRGGYICMRGLRVWRGDLIDARMFTVADGIPFRLILYIFLLAPWPSNGYLCSKAVRTTNIVATLQP